MRKRKIIIAQLGQKCHGVEGVPEHQPPATPSITPHSYRGVKLKVQEDQDQRMPKRNANPHEKALKLDDFLRN